MSTPDVERTKEDLLQEVKALRERVAQLESAQIEQPETARYEQSMIGTAPWIDDFFHSLVDGVEDHAVFMLDPHGSVTAWNSGAERLWGYSADEILGRQFSCFYTDSDVAGGEPEEDLGRAMAGGQHTGSGLRVRKDGSHVLVSFSMDALYDHADRLYGFSSVVRDIANRERARQETERLNAELERRVDERTAELAAANQELTAFSYSVSHDLRSPLRAIDGFSQQLTEDYADVLDSVGLDYLNRVRSEAQRMGELIDGLLDLSRVTRTELTRRDVNVSEIARQIAERLQLGDPQRQVEFVIAEGLIARADERLLRIALENLLENAWKFTSSRLRARIEFGAESGPDGSTVWFVRDNGVGFDMAYSGHLFGAFQRLHAETEFPGTGIGLATVKRIIHRHGGQAWAEAEPDQGAAFFFTL